MNQINNYQYELITGQGLLFQSPRSGKFESNEPELREAPDNYREVVSIPIDRGNLNQIQKPKGLRQKYSQDHSWFQSPRSGKFESNN